MRDEKSKEYEGNVERKRRKERPWATDKREQGQEEEEE